MLIFYRILFSQFWKYENHEITEKDRIYKKNGKRLISQEKLFILVKNYSEAFKWHKSE